MSNIQSTEQVEGQEAIIKLLQKHKLVTSMLDRQDMPHHDLVQSLVRKQNLAQLHQILDKIAPIELAHLLEQLPPEDQLLVWDQLSEGKKERLLTEIPLSVLQVVGKREYRNERLRVRAFELRGERLHEIPSNAKEGLANGNPIWIDLVAPTFEERLWVGDMYGVNLPDPDKFGDLKTNARFYMTENAEVHLYSDFLLDKVDVSRNVAVAFILHRNILFSIRKEELPVFRLQRMRALSQPNYVSDARDVLLDLYAADVEYSAEALEDVYRGLENAGTQVLNKQVTDEQAATILSAIAHEEDLNGRIRSNVLDTRRAVSFLMRSKLLEKLQLEDAQQILRDIESLDGHTTFLFGKINFLMDATVGFININQNKVIKQLTVISVVFMPLNVIAGIGGMSEFSMMTQGIPWPLAYGGLVIGLALVGWITFYLLHFFEQRKLYSSQAARR